MGVVDFGPERIFFARSTSGGTSWSAKAGVSNAPPGSAHAFPAIVAGNAGEFSYIQPDGFGYPFGDYFEMDIDDRGDTHAVWGEGLDYQTPGSIWYTRGR